MSQPAIGAGGTLVIRLIGKPGLERDGVRLDSPRGSKSWALMARVVRSQVPVSRQQLVTELFSEADDPMGALRWSLAELRRRTGLPQAFSGNPIVAQLGPGVAVDVTLLAQGVVPNQIPQGEFLEGVEVRGSATFETWLLVERQRVASEVLSALRQAALRALAGRDYQRAIEIAGAMVQHSPLDETPHVLLVKALAASGDEGAALRQVAASEAMLTRELGVRPGPAIRGASRPGVATPVPGVSPRTYVDSLRSAGLAALSAGAADAGIECLRGATAAAEASGDAALISECMLELGTALVHAVRGYDDEGSIILGSAVEMATGAGLQSVAAKALTEMGYIDFLASRRLSSLQRLAQARELALGDPGTMAKVASFEAANFNDWGKYDQAVERFNEAVELHRSAGNIRGETWALGIGARTFYLLERFGEAEEWADRSDDLVQQDKWTAFRPWNQAWRAHIHLARGDDPEVVRAEAEAAYSLARQLQDPCWEGVASKAMALSYLAQGNSDLALEWIQGGTVLCRRVSDSYKWVDVELLVAEAEIALKKGDHERALSGANRAVLEAAKGSLDGLLARAQAVQSGAA
jgi:DNA-binding SARP family transcriptional activator